MRINDAFERINKNEVEPFVAPNRKFNRDSNIIYLYFFFIAFVRRPAPTIKKRDKNALSCINSTRLYLRLAFPFIFFVLSFLSNKKTYRMKYKKYSPIRNSCRCTFFIYKGKVESIHSSTLLARTLILFNSSTKCFIDKNCSYYKKLFVFQFVIIIDSFSVSA